MLADAAGIGHSTAANTNRTPKNDWNLAMLRDEFEGRLWADHHHILSEQAAALFENTAVVFRRLTARLYDAPWQRGAQKPRAQ